MNFDHDSISPARARSERLSREALIWISRIAYV